MTRSRILVAGVGNIFFGDDGFGVDVVQRLAQRGLPESVRVVDFGIRGLDLTYALLDGYDTVIVVDAVPHGEAPGTLYVIEPRVDPEPGAAAEDLTLQAHGMDPAKVLRVAAALGAQVRHVLLVGCEPGVLGSDEELQMGLSDPVRAAVDRAVGLVESLISELLQPEQEAVRQ